MKRIAFLILLLSAVALAVPYYVGSRAEQDLRTRLEIANQEIKASSPSGDIRLVDYRRGWLASQGRIEFKLPSDLHDAAGQPVTLASSIRVSHGPVPALLSGNFQTALAIVRVDTRISEWLAATGVTLPDSINQSLAAYPPVGVELRVAFDKSADWLMKADAYEYQDPSGDWSLRWSALAGQGKVGPNRVDANGSLTLEQVDLTAKALAANLGLKGLSADVDFKRHVSGLYFGRTKFLLKELQAKMDVGEFKMVGLGASADTSGEDGAFGLRINYRLDGLDLTEAGGPSHRAGGEVGFSLKGLDLVALKQLSDAAGALQASGTGEPDFAALMPSVQQLFSESLKHGPSISISPMNLRFDNSKITGELNLSLPKTEPSQLALGALGLLTQVRGQAKLTIPEELARTAMEHYLGQQMALSGDEEEAGDNPGDTQASMALIATTARDMINQAVGDGWARRQDKNLYSEMKLEKGNLTVNGKPFPGTGKR